MCTEMNQCELDMAVENSEICKNCVSQMTPSAQIPELSFLLAVVEKTYGRKLTTTTDFESLSVVIEHETGGYISSSTLKRMWGYVSLNPTPRRSTLDILARYVGKRDFSTFCEDLKTVPDFESSFFTTKHIAVADLQEGAGITIGWAPNRVVVMKYLGNFLFEVISSANSKLEVGDRFELSNLMLGYPLYISRILRNGSYTPSYVAGRLEGLNLLEID